MKALRSHGKVMELISRIVRDQFLCYLHRLAISCIVPSARLHSGQLGWADDFNVGITVIEFVATAMTGITAKNDPTPTGFI